MSEFKTISVGSKLKLTSGFPFASAQFSNEGFPLIRIRDVLSSQTETYFSGSFPPGYVIKKGNVLVGMDGDFHVVRWRGCDALLNQRVLKIDVHDESVVVLDYLFHWLGPFIKKINDVTAATTVKHLSTKDLIKAKASFPSVAAQRLIAAILTSIDTAIEKTEALIGKYQHIKAGLMHDLFTRGVLPNGTLRPRSASISTPFGLIPSDWHLGSILELTDTIRQPILTGPFGADLGNADFVAEGVPVLRIGNVQQGHLDLKDLLYVSPRKAESLSRYRIKAGDLLFARQGATTGRNALADHRVEGNLINYHIIRVALSNERCAPLFVETAFNNEIIKRQIERDKGRGTREGINTAQLTSLAFPVAPLDEQRLIADILAKHNRAIQTVQAERYSLSMLKIGLMQDLLTGKVKVKIDSTSGDAINV